MVLLVRNPSVEPRSQHNPSLQIAPQKQNRIFFKTQRRFGPKLTAERQIRVSHRGPDRPAPDLVAGKSLSHRLRSRPRRLAASIPQLPRLLAAAAGECGGAGREAEAAREERREHGGGGGVRGSGSELGGVCGFDS